MYKPTLRERLQYRFDNSMSKGWVALIAWLTLFTLAFLFLSSVVFWWFSWVPEGHGTPDYWGVVWIGLMRTLDPGTMGADEGSWGAKLSMLWITLGGIFVVSTLIGVLTSGIETKIDQLRAGRSRVIESDHTVVLNWSPKVYTILEELNENHLSTSCVVILSDQSKPDMEDAIRDNLPRLRNVRVVCRHGSPTDLVDLERISIQTSRSIIVLGNPSSANPDNEVIKTVLTITHNPNRRKEPYSVIAELQDPSNEEALKLVGKGEVIAVVASQLVARAIVQTCRQSGLSTVLSELLSFEGHEIYFNEAPELVGKPFAQVVMCYPHASPIGVHRDGETLLDPPMTTVFGKGHKLVVIGEHQHAAVFSDQTVPIVEQAIAALPPSTPQPEQILILGWNRNASGILRGLNAYVTKGSACMVLTETRAAAFEIQTIEHELDRLHPQFVHGDTTQRATLESLKLERFTKVILLCADTIDPQEADARVLVSLLHLRHLSTTHHYTYSLVSEMLDVHNRQLASMTKADDFIVSQELVSLMLTQLSENHDLHQVFSNTFDPQGADIYVLPITQYLTPGIEVTYATAVESARRKNEVAIGYRLLAESATPHHGVHLNPPKEARLTFGERDKLIVMSRAHL